MGDLLLFTSSLVASCASSRMNDTERGKKRGFGYGKLRAWWRVPRRMKYTAGGLRDINRTCSREGCIFNELR